MATAVRGKLFTPAEQRAEQANWVIGASFIIEGSIPFAASDPVRVIPSMMVGSATTVSLSLAFGATLQAPHGGIFVVGLIGNWPLYLLDRQRDPGDSREGYRKGRDRKGRATRASRVEGRSDRLDKLENTWR